MTLNYRVFKNNFRTFGNTNEYSVKNIKNVTYLIMSLHYILKATTTS